MLLDNGFYPNRAPGLIVTALVCLSFLVWALVVAYINFGPGRRRPED